MFTKPQLVLLCEIAKAPVMVNELSPRQQISGAALYAGGSVTLKSTLNTARLTITRMGREQLAFYQSEPLGSDEALQHIQREAARVQVRDTLDVQHRLSQPKHEQKAPAKSQRHEWLVAEVERLRDDCGQFYQAVSHILDSKEKDWHFMCVFGNPSNPGLLQETPWPRPATAPPRPSRS